MTVRDAVEADLPAVAAIYDREVESGVATFDLEPRPLTAWRDRWASPEPGDHLLVTEVDGDVVGYASSGPYRPKVGYRYTRETTIYVVPQIQGHGIGRRLYDELVGRLVEDRMHLAVAAIALPNDASRALHRACGFEEIGAMREVGRKHDRWIDVLWVQRSLSPG